MTLILILIVVGIFLFFYINKKTKKLTISQVNLITGAPKTGKSLLCVCLSCRDHKKRHRKWRVKSFFQKLFKKPVSEEPLLYSNIPLKCPYVPLTKELLLRQKRFNYDSTIFIDEAYLVADSMSFGCEDVDDALSYFVKLIGHELHGGALFYDTQNVKDCHYAFKRCSTTYLYIRDKKKYPFFMRLNTREIFNTEEVPIQNITQEDAQLDPAVKTILVPKKYFKYYDCYALSKLTDNLPVANNVIEKTESLKTSEILSLKKFIKEEKQKNKKQRSIVNEK